MWLSSLYFIWLASEVWNLASKSLNASFGTVECLSFPKAVVESSNSDCTGHTRKLDYTRESIHFFFKANKSPNWLSFESRRALVFLSYSAYSATCCFNSISSGLISTFWWLSAFSKSLFCLINSTFSFCNLTSTCSLSTRESLRFCCCNLAKYRDKGSEMTSKG